MDAAMMTDLGKLGGVICLSMGAIGSALGIGAAGPAAVGAWKKAFSRSKPASFIMVTFIGAPLSQTIYAMILMFRLMEYAAAAPERWPLYLGAGLFGGVAIGLPAWFQGIIGAAGADALGETDKGFGNYVVALGIVETVSLFALIFLLIAVK